MRRFTAILAFALALGALSFAQIEPKPVEVPRTELYLGYSYLHASASGSTYIDSTGLQGFAFEFSHYFPSKLGFTIDLSRASNSRVDSTGIKYSRAAYLGGLSYRLRTFNIFTPSVHVLAGVDHDDLTVPFTNTSLDFRNVDPAAAAGVTFDANLSRHFAARLAQVDYVYTHHYSSSQSSIRYTGGIVARF